MTRKHICFFTFMFIFISISYAKNNIGDSKFYQYYNQAGKTTNLDEKLRLLNLAIASTDDSELKVKAIISQAYVHHERHNKDLALSTIEAGLTLPRLGSDLKNKLMSTKICICEWHNIRELALVEEAKKLIRQRDFRTVYPLYLYIGQDFIKEKNFHEALGLFENLERYSSKNSRPFHVSLIKQLEIVGLHLRQKDCIDDIIRKMKRSKAPGDLLSWFYYVMGRSYSNFGDTQKAKSAFDDSIKQNSGYYYACLSYIEKGKILNEENNLDEAINALKRAQDIAENSYFVYLAGITIADTYIKNKDYSKAKESLSDSLRVISKTSKSSGYEEHKGQLLYKLADINVKEEKYPAAARDYKTISQNPEYSKRLREMAAEKADYYSNIKIVDILKKVDELLNASDHQSAMREVDVAIKESSPGSSFYYSSTLKKVTVLYQMNEYTKALEILDSIPVDQIPSNSISSFFNSKINILKKQEKPNDVISAYKEFSKYNVGASLGLADYLFNLQYKNEAIACLQNIINNPQAARGLRNDAIMKNVELYFKSDKIREGITLLLEVLNNKDIDFKNKSNCLYKNLTILDESCEYPLIINLIARYESFQKIEGLELGRLLYIKAKALSCLGNNDRAKYELKKAEGIFASEISFQSEYKKNSMALRHWLECDDLAYQFPLAETTYNCKTDSFSLNTNLHNNSNLTINYIIPVDDTGKPLKSANNMIFFAPYAGDRNTLKPEWRRYYAERLGYSVFSMEINYDQVTAYERDKSYVFKESGSHDIVFNAYKKIAGENGLEERKLLVVGESSGGTFAQQLAVHNPDRIDAVAMIGGRTFDPIDENASTVWLALNTWGDFNIPKAQSLLSQFKHKQIIYTQTPSVISSKGSMYHQHASGTLARRLMHEFIDGVVKLRENNNGVMPKESDWPVKWQSDDRVLYFPSEKFKYFWNKLPQEGNTLHEFANYEVMVPQNIKQSSIIFFIHDPKFQSLVDTKENMYFFYRRNYIVASVPIKSNLFETVEDIKTSLKDILQNEQWKTLKINVIGSGIGGQLASVAAMSVNSPRINRIVTFNSEYEYPFEKLSIANYRGQSNIPLIMLSDHQNLYISPDHDRTRNIVVDSQKDGFDNMWYYLMLLAAK